MLATGALLCLLAIFGAARAEQPAKTGPNQAMLSGGFMDAHPDLKYRQNGIDAVNKQRYEDAFKYFQRAAYYGDKLSQGLLAEMLWSGTGCTQDRASAYVWMDLAAERGYAIFVRERERYWSLLDDAEKKEVKEKGAGIGSVYGDAAAKPRLAKVLRRARREQTGSYLGSLGGSEITIIVPGPGGFPRHIDASAYFDPQFWDPEKYQKWQDQIWGRLNPTVTVGELTNFKPAVDVPKSRLPGVAPNQNADAPAIPEDAPRH